MGPAPSPSRRGSPFAAASSALDDVPQSDLAADHAFPWSAGRPLAWSDFQGSPPSEGSEGAKPHGGLLIRDLAGDLYHLGKPEQLDRKSRELLWAFVD